MKRRGEIVSTFHSYFDSLRIAEPAPSVVLVMDMGYIPLEFCFKPESGVPIKEPG
jgi:hypothetical protein